MGLKYFIIFAVFFLALLNLAPIFAQTDDTPTVTLDRDSYPIPWGEPDDFQGTPLNRSPNLRSIYPLHLTSYAGEGPGIDSINDTIGNGDVMIHVQIHDQEANKSPAAKDEISRAGFGIDGELSSHGPVTVYITRANQTMFLATAGFQEDNGDSGRITNGTDVVESEMAQTRELGPITETGPDTGVFAFDLAVRYTDGPASKDCPDTTAFLSINGTSRSDDPRVRFYNTTATSGTYCILNGDMISVTYSGISNTDSAYKVSDNAVFESTTGGLKTDSQVYIIGSRATMTLTDPDLNLDSSKNETYSLDLIEWDSDTATITMGYKGGQIDEFKHNRFGFAETGPNTGIFQTIFQIPATLNNDTVQRGEEIVLEYTDWSTSGSGYVGSNDEDVDTAIYSSNFGASMSLDKESYNSTDTMLIAVTDPVHNLNNSTIDHIGTLDSGELRIKSADHELKGYQLDETGPDTGIFSGTVTFNGDTTSGSGPQDGLLQVKNGDMITLEYEFSGDETVVGSATIQGPAETDAVLPPMQQVENGVPLDQVECADDRVPVHRSSNGHIACVKSESVSVLIERGWAEAA